MWAVYAFLSAFFVASTDPIAKKILKDRSCDEYLVGWLVIALSTPFLGIYCFSQNGVIFNVELLKTLALVLPLEIAAAILYYKSLRLTDISLSVPFIALTPVFLILTSFLLLGEKISLSGFSGVILMAIGVYSINFKEVKHGLLQPIRAVFADKGSLYMILVAFIYSITSAFGKKAMLESSPQSIPFVYNVSISLVMAPIIVYRIKSARSEFRLGKAGIPMLILLGLCSALSSIFYFKSIVSTNVTYAIAIKRLSLLISVLYGWWFFREREVHIRILAALSMFAGAAIIILGR